MAEEVIPVTEVRKVRIEYEIQAPNVPMRPSGIDPAELERFVLAVLARQGSRRTPL